MIEPDENGRTEITKLFIAALVTVGVGVLAVTAAQAEQVPVPVVPVTFNAPLDPIITGPKGDRVTLKPDAAALIRLCDAQCQHERLNYWRKRLGD